MLKGIGLLCLVLCGGICGFLAANRIRQKQEQLVHLAAFLHELEIRMWCHGGTLQELFQQLSEQETYQTFSFLSNTLIAMQQVSFTEAWKTSVQADKELSPDSQQMLCELGEELPQPYATDGSRTTRNQPKENPIVSEYGTAGRNGSGNSALLRKKRKQRWT